MQVISNEVDDVIPLYSYQWTWLAAPTPGTATATCGKMSTGSSSFHLVRIWPTIDYLIAYMVVKVTVVQTINTRYKPEYSICTPMELRTRGLSICKDCIYHMIPSCPEVRMQWLIKVTVHVYQTPFNKLHVFGSLNCRGITIRRRQEERMINRRKW